MSLDLTQLDREIAIGVTVSASPEECAEIISRINAACERAKELKGHLEAALMEWVKENGDLTIGTVRYYIGTEKKTKFRDVTEAVGTMLELFGPKGLAECLSSNAMKYGATRQMLEESGSLELYDKLFEESVEEVLKDGKPVRVKKLIKQDTKFLR